MQHRQGNLHICLNAEKDHPFIAAMRMVKPWTEWVLVLMPKRPDVAKQKRSIEDWTVIASEMIGDKSVGIEILDVSGWAINETSADVISKGNV